MARSVLGFMQPALKIGRCFQRSRGKRRVVLQRFEQDFRRWRKTEASLGLAAAQTQHRRKQFAREKCRAALGQFGVNNFTAIRQTYYLAPHVSDPSVCVFVTEISNSNVRMQVWRPGFCGWCVIVLRRVRTLASFQNCLVMPIQPSLRISTCIGATSKYTNPRWRLKAAAKCCKKCKIRRVIPIHHICCR